MVQAVKSNGKIYHFPDEATPEQMQDMVTKEQAIDQLKYITDNSLFQRPLRRATEDVVGVAKGIGQSLSEGVPALARQALNDPATATRNVAAGLFGLPSQIANMGMNIPAYLTHLVSDTAAEKVKEYTPQIDVQGGQRFMVGGEETPEDQPIRNLTGNIPVIAPMLKGAANLAYAGESGIANKLTGNNSPKVNLLKEKLLEKTGANNLAQESEKNLKYEAAAQTGNKTPESLEYKRKNAQVKLDRLNAMSENPEIPDSQVEEAKRNYDIAHDDYLTAKASAIGDIGINSPYAIKNRLDSSKEKLSFIKENLEKNPPTTDEELQAAHKAVENAVAEHDEVKNISRQQFGTGDENSIQFKLNENHEKISDINKALQEHTQTEFPDLDQSKSILANAENTHNESIKIGNKVDRKIGKLLNEDAVHDVENARIAKKKLEENRKDIGSIYDEIENDLKDKNVVIGNSDEIKNLTSDLTKLIQEEGGLEKNGAAILKIGKKILDKKNVEVTPANDFVSMYKSVNGYMREAFKKAYAVGRTEEQHVTWKKRAEEAQQKLEEMEKVIKDNLGDEVFKKMNTASSRWKNEIIPLYKEPVYWKIMENEKMSASNMMSELRGGKKGSGIEIIRNILESHPEGLRNIIGQRYASSAKNLHAPKGLMKSYIEKSPELKTLLGEKAQADAGIAKAKENIDQAKNNHSMNEKQHKKAAEEKQAKEKIEKELSARTEKQNLLQKFRENIQEKNQQVKIVKENRSQVKERHQESKPVMDEINEIERKIPLMEKHLTAITQAEIDSVKSKEAYTDVKKRSEDIRKIRQKLINNKADLENDIKLANEYIPRLKEAAKNTELSAQELRQINDKIKNLEDMKKKFNKRILIGLGLIATFGGFKTTFNAAKSLLGGD